MNEKTDIYADQDLRPCPVDGCLTAVHPWLKDERTEPCLAARIDHPKGWHRVQGVKPPGASKWEVRVDASNLPDGADGLEAIESLAHDYEAVYDWCAQLNTADVRPS